MPPTPTPESFSPEDRAAFERDGFVVLRGAYPRADAFALQDAWWAELGEVHGMRREDRSTWRRPALDLKGAKTAPGQRVFETGRVRGAIDGLLGEGAWDWPRDWGRAIVTPPSGAPTEAWDVPTHIWHWDGHSVRNRERLTALFVVAFVGEVAPRGGGTLVVAGSHRLVARQRDGRGLGETWRRERLLRDHPWLAALSGHAASPPDRIGAFMQDGGEADGVPLRVVELTGEPGDVVVCHPLLLHSGAPNCSDVPRMMRIKQQLMSREGHALAKRAAAARAG